MTPCSIFLSSSVKSLSEKDLPFLRSLPLELGLSWVPTFKVIPNSLRPVDRKTGKPQSPTSNVKYSVSGHSYILSTGLVESWVVLRHRVFWPGYRLFAFDRSLVDQYVSRATLHYHLGLGPSLESFLFDDLRPPR